MKHLAGRTYSLAELERFCAAGGYSEESEILRRYRTMKEESRPTAAEPAAVRLAENPSPGRRPGGRLRSAR